MSTTTPTSQKRTATTALDQLDYSATTARRATWEAYEFTVTASHTIRVINASYGDDKDNHSYEVAVVDLDGVGLPVECECPADQHHELACKHRVAVAAKGGQTLLNAALNATPCLADLPACTGPDDDEVQCFDCYKLPEDT